MLRTITRSLARWTAEPEQSTRPVALMRIALASIALAKFGAELSVFSALEGGGLVLGALFFAAATMMLVGYMTQVATACVAAALFSIYFTGGFGNSVAQGNHHQVYILLAATVLLACTPCGRSYSVDRYRAMLAAARNGQAPPPERGLLWGQRLIVLQLSALYFWTAVDKSDWAFVSGQRLGQIFTWTYSGRPLDVVIAHPAILAALSVLLVAIEYFLAVGVLVTAWHRLAIPLGLALHAGPYLLLPVGTYSITMIVLYLALPDPDRVHRFLDGLQGHAPVAYRL